MKLGFFFFLKEVLSPKLPQNTSISVPQGELPASLSRVLGQRTLSGLDHIPCSMRQVGVHLVP